MIANYHTHTVRCHHASGTEREYIEYAVARGLRILGFADHSPMPFPNGYHSSFRMGTEEVPDYVTTLLALRDEYRDRIDIRIGFEAEYYPAVFPDLLALLAPYPIDYLILGQHFLGNEQGEMHYGDPASMTDPARLTRYTDQVIAGMQTGAFSYVAHPDVFIFHGDKTFYQTEAERLCRAAKALAVPLEVNMLGLCDHRFYPCPLFWEVATAVGNDVVLGCDAHSPARVADPAELEQAYAFLDRYQLRPHLLETVSLRPPCAR